MGWYLNARRAAGFIEKKKDAEQCLQNHERRTAAPLAGLPTKLPR